MVSPDCGLNNNSWMSIFCDVVSISIIRQCRLSSKRYAYPLFILEGMEPQRLGKYKDADTIDQLPKGVDHNNTSKTYFWKTLPSSDVWCRGEKRLDRYLLIF